MLRSGVAQIAFAGLIPALEGRRIDLIVSGMYIDAQRTQVIDMMAYVYVGNQVVVLTGNPKHITGKDGLCGLNVAAPVGTAFENSAKEASAACTSGVVAVSWCIGVSEGSSNALASHRVPAVCRLSLFVAGARC